MNQSETPETLVKVDATMGMDEVAAIKVAEVERECLVRQAELLSGLKKAEAHVGKLGEDLSKAVVSDTRAEHPELEKIEAMMKGFFGKDAQLIINSHHDSSGQVVVQISGKCYRPLKGQQSKGIIKEIEQTKKDIAAAEDNLCTVKKQLTQMPFLERSAKAAVAKARLMQSDAGKSLLAQMDKVTLPGLPAPKK